MDDVISVQLNPEFSTQQHNDVSYTDEMTEHWVDNVRGFQDYHF